eukprot:scaffold8190_cov248-Ochromonas_danica.AAC.1
MVAFLLTVLMLLEVSASHGFPPNKILSSRSPLRSEYSPLHPPQKLQGNSSPFVAIPLTVLCQQPNSNDAQEKNGEGLLAGRFASFSQWYFYHLVEHPFRTKMISSALVGALGDLLLQLYLFLSLSNPFSLRTLGQFLVSGINFHRLFVLMVVSALYGAPITHVWFEYLNNLPGLQGLSSWKRSMAMMLLDQTLGAIAVTAGFFFCFDIVDRILPPHHATLSSNLMTWVQYGVQA